MTALLSALYFRRTKTFKLRRESFLFMGARCARCPGWGVSSLIIQLAIVIVMAVANNMINRYGPDSIDGANIPLSAVGIVMKVFAIVIAFAVGIGVGGQPTSWAITLVRETIAGSKKPITPLCWPSVL